MDRQIIAVLGLVALASCTTGSTELEPIPGSLTYNGQPSTRLTKSPIGSTFSHDFYDGSRQVLETYVIQPDRSVKLVRREYQPDLLSFND
ncbi:hypothetical protein [Rhizobium sp. FY34]|uniref:hypothetical protein n=1 Tax=Rhizobium sp. FY34 TaxID=2562309 RepID=UPI0010C12C72|nr:hypothetical protein [Rhizobium sp. FY34]